MTLPPGIMDGMGDFTITAWLRFYSNAGNFISLANSTALSNEFTFHRTEMTVH